MNSPLRFSGVDNCATLHVSLQTLDFGHPLAKCFAKWPISRWHGFLDESGDEALDGSRVTVGKPSRYSPHAAGAKASGLKAHSLYFCATGFQCSVSPAKSPPARFQLRRSGKSSRSRVAGGLDAARLSNPAKPDQKRGPEAQPEGSRGWSEERTEPPEKPPIKSQMSPKGAIESLAPTKERHPVPS
jgi:hypothetical protein